MMIYRAIGIAVLALAILGIVLTTMFRFEGRHGLPLLGSILLLGVGLGLLFLPDRW
jgi:hypothetical protein